MKIVNPNFTAATELAPEPDPTVQRVSLAEFVTGLLRLLKTIASQSDLRESEEFCTTLDRFATETRRETSTSRLDELRHTCLQTSGDYFEYWRRQLTEREAEFRDLIGILMTAVQTINRDNQSFNATLVKSNERLHSFSNLHDIRDLKTKLREEVSHLQTTITEKQQSDADRSSDFDRRINQLQARLQVVEQQAATDGLTGIANRATFDRQLRELIVRAQPFVLAMFDIDNFKQINDTRGHQIGDQVIIATAKELKDTTRANDLVARYGGEEFAVIHVGSRTALSMPRFTTLIEKIAQTQYSFAHVGDPVELNFTISCGITQFRLGDAPESVIARADAALYQAKKQGKNRLIVG